ncbi:hypothetical protein ACQP3F_30315, partial [Escherichia coli]
PLGSVKLVIYLSAKVEVVTSHTRTMIKGTSHLDKNSINDDIFSEQIRRSALNKPMGDESKTCMN